MKNIYLVRHAKAESPGPLVMDFKRALNPRGEEAVLLMGERLKEKNISPQLFLTSPAIRTMTTAQGIAKCLGKSMEDIFEEETIYNASLKTLVEVIHDLDNKYDNVMLFGHNPGMTELANYLGDAPVSHMPTCAVYGVSFDLNDWRKINAKGGTCLFFDYPKKMG